MMPIVVVAPPLRIKVKSRHHSPCIMSTGSKRKRSIGIEWVWRTKKETTAIPHMSAPRLGIPTKSSLRTTNRSHLGNLSSMAFLGEVAMNGRRIGELGVERRHQPLTFFDEHRLLPVTEKHARLGSQRHEFGRSNENAFHWFFGRPEIGRFDLIDKTFRLPAIGVSNG